MKLRRLLPIVFLALTGLVGCGPKDVYDVNITNTDAIIEEWHVGDAARTLTVEATKNGEAVNATQLLNTELFVTSSNEEVLTALGFVLTPVSAGEVTVKVKYNTVEVELGLQIKPVRTCIDKYQTVHAGTEADPLDAADAVKIAKYVKENALTGTSEEDIYIKGVVKSWYHFPGERKGNDEATSFYLEVAEGAEAFEVYKCVNSQGKSLSDEDIWVGAEVLVYGQIGFYNTTWETTKATFVRVTGGSQRVAPETKQVNVSNAIKAGKALSDGDTTWDKYVVTGYVVNDLGKKNYMIADSKTEVATSKQFEIYGSTVEFKYQDKVQVTCRIKNYHGTIETNVIEKIEVVENGIEWPSYQEPAKVTGKGLADLFADNSGNNKVIYEVEGIVSKWYKDNENGTKYGNFYLKAAGSDTEYLIYGATAKTSALAWNKIANVYVFTNPQDFLSNNTTKAIKIGDKVKMQLTRCDYKDSKTNEVTLEANGIVLSVTPAN